VSKTLPNIDTESNPLAPLGSVYMVLDFMDHDLGGLIESGVLFQTQHIMCIAQQIFSGASIGCGLSTHSLRSGLLYLHNHDIIHRDLKRMIVLLYSLITVTVFQRRTCSSTSEVICALLTLAWRARVRAHLARIRPIFARLAQYCPLNTCVIIAALVPRPRAASGRDTVQCRRGPLECRLLPPWPDRLTMLVRVSLFPKHSSRSHFFRFLNPLRTCKH
jgi:hypothetical protein